MDGSTIQDYFFANETDYDTALPLIPGEHTILEGHESSEYPGYWFLKVYFPDSLTLLEVDEAFGWLTVFPE